MAFQIDKVCVESAEARAKKVNWKII